MLQECEQLTVHGRPYRIPRGLHKYIAAPRITAIRQFLEEWHSPEFDIHNCEDRFEFLIHLLDDLAIIRFLEEIEREGR